MSDPPSGTSTGYGPSGRWNNLQFDGDARRYEQWEVKFLGYMRLKKLKETINPDETTDADAGKNEEAFAELIQFLDDRSLSLVMRDGKDKGRESLNILRDYYRGKGKQRVICLYTELTSLMKRSSETIIDYLIRAETAASGLKDAGEDVSDGLLVAMVLKGLPSQFKSFVTVITQSEKTWTFKDLKINLRDYEDTENARNSSDSSSQIMKTNNFKGVGKGGKKITCYSCHLPGHKSNACPSKKHSKKWCKLCRSASHNDAECRRQKSNDIDEKVKHVREVSEEHTFYMKLDESKNEISESCKDEVCCSFLVDSGCTSHIVVSDSYFIDIDESFHPEKHFVELADGRKYNNVALKRGSVKVTLIDNHGKLYNLVLENCLYIPSYPENIFSIKAATLKGSSVNFSPHYAELVTENGTCFEIHSKGKLFYLTNVTFVNRVCDLRMWHNILGHCNLQDLVKLEEVVEGMKISNSDKFQCEPCILGKQTVTRNKNPSTRSKFPLEFVSSDVCGPVDPVSSDGFRYTVSFVDNYSGFIFLYFMKRKSDATNCLLKFLADVSPIGKVKCMLDINSEFEIKKFRSDGGGEYMSKDFKEVLIKNGIKHEQSAPYSPHQNGVAERGWRTLFEMGRCLLIGSGLPKILWPYAVMASSYIRNRCFQQRTSQTPYFLLTGRKPNLSDMHVFGSVCYTYVQHKTKLDPRSKRGIFIGYDKESPAFLIYYPESKKVMRCRNVKFTDLFEKEAELLYVKSRSINNDDFPGDIRTSDIPVAEEPTLEFVDPVDVVVEVPAEAEEIEESVIEVTDVPVTGDGEVLEGRYPRRNRNRPRHFDDYVVDGEEEDEVSRCIDFCKMVNVDVPKSYVEAMSSPDSKKWKEAMDDEMKSLLDNHTFDVVPLPQNKRSVGGRWVYSVKEGPDEREIFKARYVAKGFTQVHGSDYFETFSPTAKLTSIRILMQVSVQCNLIVHQLDVKTAYLNAPIDVEIYVKQPEGYEVNCKDTYVCKLNKSLYGLKQSGRNWNNLLHKFFIENGFTQSMVDPCVYFYRNDSEYVIALVWVDDIVLAASSNDCLSKIKNLLKSNFQMKDFGPISSFLGIKFVQKGDRIEVDQSKYLNKVLAKFGMEQCKPRSTPCEVNPSAFSSDVDVDEPQKKYREIVGSLIYAMVCTRPDLSWTVTKLSQHLDKPTKADWVMIKHVLRYVKGTLNYKLVYKKSESGLVLCGYSDSDWAGSSVDRRSTTGYYFSLNPDGPPVSWKSKKQSTVALSSCEAEYMALSASAQEAKFLSMLYKDFNSPDTRDSQPVVINADNQGAISLVKNSIVQNRSKHIDIRHHYIRESYSNKLIDIVYIPTELNVADVMTKPTTKQKLERFRKKLFGD